MVRKRQHRNPLGIRTRIHEALEETDRIMRDTFFIGVYPGLSDEMVEYVIDQVGAFFKERLAAAKC